MDSKTNSGHVVIRRADGWYLSGRSQAAGVAAWGTLRWAQTFTSYRAAEATAGEVGGVPVALADATAAPAEAEDGDELGDVDEACCACGAVGFDLADGAPGREPGSVLCPACAEHPQELNTFDDGPQDTRGIW